jgi:hypothetical protein
VANHLGKKKKKKFMKKREKFMIKKEKPCETMIVSTSSLRKTIFRID